MPLVSIIIPIYNTKKFLPTCLESVRCQTHHSFECICVDDGSTDGSERIIQSYVERDTRFKLFYQKNARLGAARNNGFKHATGDYIFYLDSDDALHPKILERLLLVQQQGDYDITTAQWQTIDCDALTSEQLNHQTYGLAPHAAAFTKDVLEVFVRRKLARHGVWGKLYKRELLSGICFPESRFMEDLYWTLLVMAKTRSSALLDEPLYYYRKHGCSIMGREWDDKKIIDLFYIIELTYQALLDQHEDKVASVLQHYLSKQYRIMIKLAQSQKTETERCNRKLIVTLLKEHREKGILRYTGLSLSNRWRLYRLLRYC